MYKNIFIITLLGALSPFLKKKVMEKVEPQVYLLVATIISISIQIMSIPLTKKDYSSIKYLKEPKLFFYIAITTSMLVIANYLNNILVKTESINKITPLMYIYDLILTLIVGYYFKDIEKIDKNKILGLILFILGIYLYNK